MSTSPEENDPLLLIDALPYYDKEYSDESLKRRVHRLVAAESKKIARAEGPPDADSRYISHLGPSPPPDNFSPVNHPFLFELFARYREGRMDTPMYDPSRYCGEFPESLSLEDDDVDSLFNEDDVLDDDEDDDDPLPEPHLGPQQPLRPLLLRQAHGDIGLVNLQLLKTHHKVAWHTRHRLLGALERDTRRDAETSQTRIEKLNRKRKREQMEAGDRIARLQSELATVRDDISKAELECGRHRKRIKLMQTLATSGKETTTTTTTAVPPAPPLSTTK